MEDNRDIEKSARSKLGSYKMEPPEGAWNALDADLDKKQAIIMTKKANRFKMLSIALVLILVSFVSFYYLTPPENAVHTSEVSDTQLPAIHVNPLPGNGININTESLTGNSDKPAVSISENIISTGNKNETVASYQNNNSDNKNLFAENARVETKHTHKKPDVYVRSNNDASVTIANNIKAITEENVVSEISLADWVGRAGTEDSIGNVATNISEIEKTDSSSTGLLYNKEEVTKSRISFALFYSPDYSWTKLKDNTSDNIDDAAMYNSRENSEFSYTTGLALHYYLNDKWSLVSGITYSTLTKSITLQTLYGHANSNNEMHIMYPTSNGMIEMPVDDSHPDMHEGDSINTRADGRQLIKFINVPLMVRVQATKKKFTFYANGGFSVNFIVQEKAKIKMDNSEMTIVNHVQGLNKMNYGFLLGVGVQYNIFNGMDLFTEPVFRGSITSVTHNTAVNSYPYSLGLKTGIFFRF